MNKILANCISLGIGLGAIGVAFPTQAASFQGLGDLPEGGFFSRANGVSANGSVVVGWSVSANGDEAFRWTQATGMVGLGDLPEGDFNSTANGVSADGSVIVGYGTSANGGEAFIWNIKGMRSLKEVLTRPLAKVLSRSLYSNIFEDYQLLINN